MSDEHKLTGGELNAALAIEIGRVVASATGRGASRSRAFLSHDAVVCLLDNGVTVTERALVKAGRSDMVRHQREVLHRSIEVELVATVERLTGRHVQTFVEGMSTLAETQAEVFVLAPEPG